MRWVKRAILIILALIFVLIGLPVLYAKWSEFHRDRFYAARPITGAMRAVWPERFAKDRTDVREAFLRQLPLGTDKSNVVKRLSQEGFYCQQSSIRKGWTDCQLHHAPGGTFGYTNWILDFQFDGEDRLTDVRIVIQPIFF